VCGSDPKGSRRRVSPKLAFIRVPERRGHVGAAARVWLSSMHDRQIRSFKIRRHSQRAAQNRHNRYRRQGFTGKSVSTCAADEAHKREHC
jgi:hypothetical protein